MQRLGPLRFVGQCRIGGNLQRRPLLGRLCPFINILPNLPDQKTAKNSAFIEMLRLADDHLIKHI